MHRRTKKLLIVFGGIVVVLVGLYVVALIRANAKLNAAIRALEEDGRPMEAAELIPPEIPEAQNAAPLYVQAVKPLANQVVTRRRSLLQQAGRLAFSVMGDTIDSNDLAELKEMLARDEFITAMATVEQALQRPKCRFDCGYQTGLDTERTTPGDLREVGRLRGAQAYFEAQAGRSDRAWEMVQTQFKLAEALRREPTLDGQCARIGIIRDLSFIIEKLYDIAPPSEAVLQKIDALLTEHLDIGPLIYAVDAERVLRGQWLFSQPGDQFYEAFCRMGIMGYSEENSNALARLAFRIITFKPRLVADHAAYLDMMRNCVKILEGPYAPMKGPIDMEHRELSGRGLITSQISPYVIFDNYIYCATITKVNMTRAGLGLLEYKRVHGTFPESLDALGLKGLTDAYSQAPLHYRTENGGVIVYSVGEDQKDNGGKPEPPRDTSGRRQKEPIEFDIIWRYPKGVEEQGDAS